MSSLKVSNIKCKTLPNLEGKDESSKKKTDPYVIIQYLGVKKQTEEKDNDLNPEFGEVFDFDLAGKEIGPADLFEVTVKDHEKIGRNRLVGKVEVALQVLTNQPSKEFTEVLRDDKGRATTGKVSFTVDYTPPAGAAGPAGGANVGGDDRQNAEEAGGDEGGEVEEEVEEFVDESGQAVPEGTPGAVKIKKKVKRKTRKSHNLPDKATDFQVRIKIQEARQLPGGNINPTVRVSLGGDSKQTNVKHSTNRPFFDETFFFNYNMRPNELFDRTINFEVYNAKKLLSDSLIGSFQCDVGLVYAESGHCLVRKWLLLTAPEDTGKDEGGEGETTKDSTGGSPAGYLKITAMCMGPGDEIPDSVKSAAKTDGDEDIESNLLRPAGVSLRPATFLVKIYRAEDVPQMDSAMMQNIKKLFSSGPPKELVDPYVKFSYAGKSVQTKIMFSNDHPEFNQELRVAFKFPSMCERLKLQMYDYDRIGGDDCIGTSFISLSGISGDGDEGFLPRFGPCFVNFYGSLREFTNLPDEYDDLNKGRGEGVAFRGRCLVEIETKFGDQSKEPVQEIMQQELVRVSTYLRRRKFKLYACFMAANMICETDGPVEFEVSIGNYGNKLDSSCEAQSSTTPPTNAVFDGIKYYYLPWAESKPCCSIESSWEDICFRLEPINILTKVVQRLDAHMQTVKRALQARAPPPEVAAALIALLDQLIKDCKAGIPEFDVTFNGVNDLDLKLQEIRQDELVSIAEEANGLRESATDIDEAIDAISGYMSRLKELITEPQNCMPDVIIWMISGSTRIAYCRVPAYKLLYSPNPAAMGANCMKLMNFVLRYPGKKGQKLDQHPEIPAQVQAMLWLGLEQYESTWTKATDIGGEVAVFAETYENNIFNPLTRNWTTKLMPRPSHSDPQGEVRLMKESFNPPPGWEWDDETEWFVDPELSASHDADAGHSVFTEDCFETQSRNSPISNWGADGDAPYTNVRGDTIEPRDEIECPEGWKWTTDWTPDINRACDEEGYEYCIERSMGGWGAVQKTYHLCRRRRWVRTRNLQQDPKKLAKKKELELKAGDGWEYAVIFGEKFHLKERKKDLVRRRRWHRKMVANDSTKPAMFDIPGEDDDDLPTRIMPRMFLSFEKPHVWQLRAYIYQARDVLGLDSEGTSDPYAVVCVGEQSQKTQVKDQTLTPSWDQTLIFGGLQVHCNPQIVYNSPPPVIVEVFDKDKIGKDEFLGRAMCTPVVKGVKGTTSAQCQLQWFPIMIGDRPAGELLAAFELFLDDGETDLPLTPPLKENKVDYIVPSGIRPVMVRTGIEILCWGVRNMKKYQLASCTSPSIQFEIDGRIIESDVIKNTKKCPNFKKTTHFIDMYLPKRDLYMPPLNIRVLDHRTFGRKPCVGRHVLSYLEKCEPKQKTFADPSAPATLAEVALDMTDGVVATVAAADAEADLDWWSKYFATIGDIQKCGKYLELNYPTIKFIPNELEQSFGNFGDFVQTFELSRGKDDDDDSGNVVGEFKGMFKFYPLPPDRSLELPPQFFTGSTIPHSDPVECKVRVYVVRAIGLAPKDPNGKADPFLEVSLGKKKISDKDMYIPNTVDPIFGRMFEFKASIPIQKDLKIRVMDYDLLSANDLIGETTIDLENRLYSKHRATCGLPPVYFTAGIYKWRDQSTPLKILENFCLKENLSFKFLSETQCVVNKKLHKIEDYETDQDALLPNLGPVKERLALHVLNSQDIVTEHIETRSLMNPLSPSGDQGQLQLWVDIFPQPSKNVPGPPIDISPRRADKFHTRVIVWNTAEVPLDETSITGEQMSDIYLKAWMGGQENEKQKTDIHYRSLDGEGMFNWRMVFPFDFMKNEKMCVVKKKQHFWSLDATEEKCPPSLTVQVWDNDKFSSDDFLGSLEFGLDKVPKPAKNSSDCSLATLTPSTVEDYIDLFKAKQVRGWFPMYVETGGVREIAGKVDLTVEIVDDAEQAERPAGKGQDEPNMNPKLDPPKRPETSFFWFTNPWKTLKLIIWKRYKWHFIIGMLLLLLTIFLVLFFYSVPGGIVKKMFGG